MHLSIDGDGWDNNGGNIIPWAFKFSKKHPDVTVAIYASQDKINSTLADNTRIPENVALVETSWLITADYEPSREMFSQFPESSMIQIIMALQEGQTDWIFSAGNTAAYIMAATLKVQRSSRNMRLALASEFPSSRKPITLWLDMWGNISAEPSHMPQYALLWQQYLFERYGLNVPVNLVSIVSERWKWDEFDEEALRLLDNLADKELIKFDSYLEPDWFLSWERKIVVWKARDMNMWLKWIKWWSNYVMSKLRLIWLRSVLNKSGWAILLGAKKPIAKANWNSTPQIVCNTLEELHDFTLLNMQTSLIDRITQGYDSAYKKIKDED